MEHLQLDIRHYSLGRTKESASPLTSKNPLYPYMDPSLPNLLEEDPFLTQTLPNLLGENFKPKGTLHTTISFKPGNLHPFNNCAAVSKWFFQCSVTISQLAFGKYATFAPNMGIKVEERKQKNSEDPEFWIFLRDGVYWNPLDPTHFSQDVNLAPHFLQKHQVTAYDFKFYYDAIMNPHIQLTGAIANRTTLTSIKDIEVIDKLTFVVRFKTKKIVLPDGKTVSRIKYTDKLSMGNLRPLAAFVYQYFPDGKKIISDEKTDTYRNDPVWAQNF